MAQIKKLFLLRKMRERDQWKWWIKSKETTTLGWGWKKEHQKGRERKTQCEKGKIEVMHKGTQKCQEYENRKRDKQR